MKKVTVNEAVAAIQSVDSKEAMQAILEQCTKAAIVEVYKAVTDQTGQFKKKLKKVELAKEVAYSLQSWREDEMFKSRSFDEKYEILTTCPDHCNRLRYALLLTVEELQATVLRLGIPTRYDDGEEFDPWAKDILADDVIKELKARETIAEIDGLMNVNDAVALKKKLMRTRSDTLKRLLERYEVSCEEDKPLDDTHMWKALYEYYISRKQSRVESEVSEHAEADTPAQEASDTTSKQSMTHEAVLKELYDICVFLQDKEAELEAKYGEAPSFESKEDRSIYDALMATCHDRAINLIRLFEEASGYKKALGGNRYHVGDGLKKARAEHPAKI